jgi:uncharacterized OsmC-like protein
LAESLHAQSSPPPWGIRTALPPACPARARVIAAYGGACDVVLEDRRMRVDLPVGVGGGATGPHPGQLWLAGLGASLLLGVRAEAAERALPLADAELQLCCEPADPARGSPAPFSPSLARVTVEVTLTSHAPERALRHAVQAAARRCPLLSLLAAEVVRELRVVVLPQPRA